MQIDRTRVKTAFASYTAAYNAEDPKIRLKIAHTCRVAVACGRIAKSEGLSGAQVEMAWLSGMLHDIGRFEQIRRYGTFNDAESINHGEFGADLLFGEGLFETFVPAGGSTDQERRQLETAIRSHSSYRIPDGLSAEETMFCHILRDADKVDILRVNYEFPIEQIYNTPREQIMKEGVTEEVRQCFRERHAVLRSLMRTTVDHLVGHICLVHELVYPESMDIVWEQGYLEKLLEFPSENPDTRAWFQWMRAYFEALAAERGHGPSERR